MQDGIRVKMQEMDRSEAESKFGFSIYQGHGVPVAKPRIVEITSIRSPRKQECLKAHNKDRRDAAPEI